MRIAIPEIVVAVSAAVWGLFWIPLRLFEQQGLESGWATLSQFIAPLLVMLPIAMWRFCKARPIGANQGTTGFLIGWAFVLYCESLLLTDVVRALVLFYVMPAWGTLAEVIFLKRRFTVWRGVALLMSISGLLCIVSTGVSDISAWTLNAGDIMALLSGIVFTLGAMRVRQTPEVSLFEQLFAFFFYGSIAAIILLALPFMPARTMPDATLLLGLAPWLLLMAIVFLIPVMGGIYWGSKRIDPGRLGILLQFEAVIGISSAGILANEPFGWPEIIGALLVIGAGIVEVFGNKSSDKD